MVVKHHEGMSWRCMACVTHKQAENIRTDAANEKKSVHDFITVPPTDSNGPAEDVVTLFVEYLEALHLEDGKRIRVLRKQLQQSRKPVGSQSTSTKGRKRNADVHHLDAQLSEDISMVDLFVVADLNSLLEHHGLDVSGTKPQLVERLRRFYGKNKK